MYLVPLSLQVSQPYSCVYGALPALLASNLSCCHHRK
jgi:hypothetical protein